MQNLDPRLRGGDKLFLIVMPAKAGIQVLHVDSHLVLHIIPALAGIQSRGLGSAGIQTSNNLFIQIPPIRVLLLDEPQLPTTAPCLQLLLTLNGGFGGFAGLVVNELIDAISGGETGDFLLFMLPDAARQVGGYPNVQGAVASVGNNVNAEGFVHSFGFPPKLTLE